MAQRQQGGLRALEVGHAHVGQRTDHFLVASGTLGNVGKLFAKRFACNRHALSMQQPVIEQHAQHLRHAARGVKIGGDETTRGLELAQHRHALSHPLEIIDGPFDFGRGSDREVVQHRIG